MITTFASLLAVSLIAPTGKAANGTTLPFQRHLVRAVAPGDGAPTLAEAVQKQGADGDGLTLYTSIDGGVSWVRDLALQPSASVRDTADLLPDPDGRGFLAVYSLEPQSSLFRVDARSDVVLVHLTLVRPGSFRIDGGPSVVFRPGRGEAYFRASLARDASGLVHVSATHLAGGVFTFRATTLSRGRFTPPETLLTSGPLFGGGRLLAAGRLVLAVYDDYAQGHPGRYRVRAAGAGASWGPERAFAPDGLYHAGAFSLTSTPDGHAHLAYSAKSSQSLQYREFDGRSWSARSTIEPVGHWSNQIALSHESGTLLFAWNHFDAATGKMGIRMRERSGNTLGPVHAVAQASSFKGYTTAIESVIPGEPWVIGWCEQRSINLPPAEAVAAPLYPHLPGLVTVPPILHPPPHPAPRLLP